MVEEINLRANKNFHNYESTYVAFLDILGFKDLVNNNPHKQLLEIYQKVIESNFKLSSSLVSKITMDSSDQKNQDFHFNFQINSLLISDSILFWTKNNYPKSLYFLLLTVKQLMHYGMGQGIPLRGSISMGPLSFINTNYQTNLNNNSMVLVGKAFSDAYLNESKQNWAGCVVKKDCIDYFVKVSEATPGAIQLNILIEDTLIPNYPVPYKTISSNEYVIDWVTFPNHKNCFSEQIIRNSFSAFNKSSKSDEVEEKILNTLKFFNHVSLNT